MVSRFGKALALALVLVALSGAMGRAAAQSWAINPFIGMYLPMGPITDEEEFGIEIEQQSTVMFGGRLLYRMQGSLGIEGEVGYASSSLEADGVEGDGGSILFLGAKLMYFFGSAENLSFHIGGGVGMTDRGGDDWEGADDSSTLGAVLNFGAIMPLGQSLKLRFDIEDYISSLAPESDLDSKMQNDILLTAGLHIPFGGS